MKVVGKQNRIVLYASMNPERIDWYGANAVHVRNPDGSWSSISLNAVRIRVRSTSRYINKDNENLNKRWAEYYE